MKASAFAATFVFGLVLATTGTARAAGQPELPPNAGAPHDQAASEGQGGGQDSVQRMETKRELDPRKYERPTANSSNPAASPSSESVQKQ